MRTIARALAYVVGFAAAATVVAQESAWDLQDLIGVKKRQADEQLYERGYTYIRSANMGADKVSYWRDSRSGRCVSVRTEKGRHTAFDYVADSACGGGSGQSGYGGSWSGSGDSASRGVTLHRDLRLGGVSESFTSDVPDLRGSQIGDDQATSVSVSPGCRARLYRDLNYEGAYLEVDSNTDDLRGSRVGDDSVTSLQVRCDGGGVGPASRGVTLHRDLRFTGASESFAGDVPDLRGSQIGDDQATSVSVSPGCRARLYRDPNFEGAYTEVDSNVDDLRASKVGDDSVTSLRVQCDGGGAQNLWHDQWGDGGNSASRGVTLHRDRSFTGVSESFASDVPDLRGSRIGDDHATSVSVSPGCQARLYRDRNYEGAYTEVDSKIDDLRASKVGDDSVTSLKVRCER